jgi:hypothetical protein
VHRAGHVAVIRISRYARHHFLQDNYLAEQALKTQVVDHLSLPKPNP